MHHRLAVLVLFLAYATGSVNLTFACTSLLVTKGASEDGSVMITYTADAAGFYPRLIIMPAEEHPEGTVIEIPENDDRPAGAIKQALQTYHVIGVTWDPEPGFRRGEWLKQGLINEHQLAITESTFGGRPELRNPQGLTSYSMLITLALQRAKTAREAIDVITSLAEEYGYHDTGESFSIADKEEAWVLELIGTGPKKPGLRKFVRADNADEVTKAISSAIVERFPDVKNFGVGITDARRITLSFNQDTLQETVESVAQMVRELPDVNEVFTVWIPSPPPGVLPQDYQNYLLTTPITTDEQALALFREAERWYIAGNFFNAKPLLERFVDQQPKPQDQHIEHVLFYLGMIAWDESRLRSNSLDEAKFYFGQLMRMFPEGVRFQESRDALTQITLGGGVVWVAKKVPDGEISAHANQARIGIIPDEPDRDNCFYSDNIRSFAIEQGWYDPASGEPFRFNYIYDEITAKSKRVCEARVWSMFRRAAPSQEFSSDYHRGVPGAAPYPWSIKPDKKLSLADVMALKRDHYEGTDFDMTKGADAGAFGLPLRWRPLYWHLKNEQGEDDVDTEYAWERPISTQQTGFSVVSQSRSHLPDMIGGVCWYGVDDTYTTCYFPLYCQITEVPKPFATGSIEEFSWDSAWWVFNLVANYANLKFDRIAPEIVKVQQELEAKFLEAQSKAEEELLDGIRVEIRSAAGTRTAREMLISTTSDEIPEVIYQRVQSQIQRFLTQYSVRCGEEVFSRWQRLAIEIFTKFNDGYIRADDGTYPREGDPYPDWWLRGVVEERPEQFKLP